MISLKDVAVQLDTQQLFQIPKFTLIPGEKVGLLAPNGTGKSVFMQQLVMKVIPHSLSLAYCTQQLPPELKNQTLNDWAAHAPEGFNFHEFYKLIQELQLPDDRPVSSFSGGQERKAALIFTLCQHAQVYFFDEPTNHLDLPSILWLERYLRERVASYLIVSHDLQFLAHTVNGFWAVHEGLLRYYAGNYDDYQQRRELEEQALAHEHAKKVIALKQEERYRERGVTARRKRNQRRVAKLHALRAELKVGQHETTTLFADLTHRSAPAGQMIVELTNYQPSYYTIEGPQPLAPITRVITRKDKIAIVGANGVGKTTLLKAILAENSNPALRHREGLRVVFLDQQRSLPPQATPFELVAGDSSFVTIEQDKESYQLHPLTYLQRFGIEPEHAYTPFGKLSGGQKMKVCLAKALARPVDVLVLDEPTNDLDIEAIEELAELLIDFNGLVLFVSHDRHLINQCATETWYLTPKRILMHPGGFEERFLDQMLIPTAVKEKKESPKAAIPEVNTPSLKEQQLKKLMIKIEESEAALEALQIQLLEPDLYLPGKEHQLKTLQQKQADLEVKIAKLYQEWEQLG